MIPSKFESALSATSMTITFSLPTTYWFVPCNVMMPGLFAVYRPIKSGVVIEDLSAAFAFRRKNCREPKRSASDDLLNVASACLLVNTSLSHFAQDHLTTKH